MEVVERLQQTVRILSDTQTGVLVAAFVVLFLVLLIQPMIFLTFKIEKSEKNSKRYTIAGCSITIFSYGHVSKHHFLWNQSRRH
jgi:amino acid permease